MHDGSSAAAYARQLSMLPVTVLCYATRDHVNAQGANRGCKQKVCTRVCANGVLLVCKAHTDLERITAAAKSYRPQSFKSPLLSQPKHWDLVAESGLGSREWTL
jgi:hypothetical protein